MNNLTAAAGVRTLAAGQWHHVAIVFDGALTESNLKLYVNGTPEKFTQITDTAVKDAASPLWIGVLNDADLLGFKGKVDEVRVYRGKALTLTEIADAYQGIPTNLGPQITLVRNRHRRRRATVLAIRHRDRPRRSLAAQLCLDESERSGGVTFTTPAASSTGATAAAGGVYVIRFTANDGQITTFADVLATITASSAYQSWLAANSLPADGTGDGAPSANPSGDGVVNAIKFALGLSVNDQGTAGTLSIEPNRSFRCKLPRLHLHPPRARSSRRHLCGRSQCRPRDVVIRGNHRGIQRDERRAAHDHHARHPGASAPVPPAASSALRVTLP